MNTRVRWLSIAAILLVGAILWRTNTYWAPLVLGSIPFIENNSAVIQSLSSIASLIVLIFQIISIYIVWLLTGHNVTKIQNIAHDTQTKLGTDRSTSSDFTKQQQNIQDERLQKLMTELGALATRGSQIGYKGLKAQLEVATAQIISICHTLNGRQKGRLVQFLSQSGLLTILDNSGFSPLTIHDADLSSIDMSNMKFSGIKFDVCNFYEANLANTEFYRCSFSVTKFENSNLQNVSFTDCYASFIKITNSDLKGMHIGTLVAGIEGQKGELINFLMYSKMSKTNWPNASLHDFRLWKADFSYAQLNNANFQDALLDGACFDGARLDQANFTGAILDSVSFRDATLDGTIFLRTDLSSADFKGAKYTSQTVWPENFNPATNSAILNQVPTKKGTKAK